MSVKKILKNIYLQSKRFSKQFDISLTQAKQVVARAIYQCHDYDDLIEKASSYSLKPSVYPYAKLAPRSDERLRNHLLKNIDLLTSRVVKSCNTPMQLKQTVESIWSVFGLPREVGLVDLYQEISTKQWQTMAKFQDQLSVLEGFLTINGSTFRLNGTRILSPRDYSYLPIGSVNTLELSFEIQLTKPPVMWFDWDHYVDAINLFIDKPDNGLRHIIGALGAKSSVSIKSKEEQERAIARLVTTLNAEFDNEKPLFARLFESSYFVFGAIDSELPELRSNELLGEFYISKSMLSNNKVLLAIENTPVILELFEVNKEGEYIGDMPEYYEKFSAAIYMLMNLNKGVIILDGKYYEAYVRPASEIEIWHQQMLKNQK